MEKRFLDWTQKAKSPPKSRVYWPVVSSLMPTVRAYNISNSRYE